VVEAIATVSCIEDTAFVGHEVFSTSMHGNGQRLLLKGSLHLGSITGFDLSVAFDFDGCLALLIILTTAPPSSIARFVGIFRLQLRHILLVVSEGTLLKTTVATSVIVSPSGAIHELLLREGKQFASCDEVSTLESTSGGERPARSTVSLVFDGSDATEFNPVNASGVGRLENLCQSFII